MGWVGNGVKVCWEWYNVSVVENPNKRYFNFLPTVWLRIRELWLEYKQEHLGLEGDLFFDQGGRRREDMSVIEEDISLRKEVNNTNDR